MTKDEALKLALEALEELADLVDDTREGRYEPDSFTTQPARTAITAIKQALAAPVQEPESPLAEGWCINFANGHSGFGVYAHMDEYPEEGAILLCGVPKWAIDALKATPPAAQWQWVGLTDGQRAQLWDEWENGHVVEATEDKLKELNT